MSGSMRNNRLVFLSFFIGFAAASVLAYLFYPTIIKAPSTHSVMPTPQVLGAGLLPHASMTATQELPGASTRQRDPSMSDPGQQFDSTLPGDSNALVSVPNPQQMERTENPAIIERSEDPSIAPDAGGSSLFSMTESLYAPKVIHAETQDDSFSEPAATGHEDEDEM